MNMFKLKTLAFAALNGVNCQDLLTLQNLKELKKQYHDEASLVSYLLTYDRQLTQLSSHPKIDNPHNKIVDGPLDDDWTQFLGPVIGQGECGNCWAVSYITVLDGVINRYIDPEIRERQGKVVDLPQGPTKLINLSLE